MSVLLAKDRPALPMMVFLLAAGVGCRSPETPHQACDTGVALSWEKLQIAGPAPSARLDHALAADEEGRRVFLFGGRGESGFLSDLWSLDLDRMTWNEIGGRDGPGPRSGHSLTYDARTKRLILFGGYQADAFGKPQYLKELWIFSENGGWERKFFKEGPAGRAWHAAAPTDEDIVFFGGFSQAPLYHQNDVWALDLQSLEFRRLATDGGPRMAGRVGLLASPSGREIWIAGRDGIPQPQRAGYWRLAVETDRWNFITRQRADPPRNFDLALAEPREGLLLLLRGPQEERHDDWKFWSFQPALECFGSGGSEDGAFAFQGLSCVAEPHRPGSFICHGGARAERFSAELWRLSVLGAGEAS